MRDTRGNGFGYLPLAVLTAGQSLNGTCQDAGIKAGTEDCKKFLSGLAETGPVWYRLQQDEVIYFL